MNRYYRPIFLVLFSLAFVRDVYSMDNLQVLVVTPLVMAVVAPILCLEKDDFGTEVSDTTVSRPLPPNRLQLKIRELKQLRQQRQDRYAAMDAATEFLKNRGLSDCTAIVAEYNGLPRVEEARAAEKKAISDIHAEAWEISKAYFTFSATIALPLVLRECCRRYGH